ncbi:ATP-binding cassette domain-containing protein, partial [Mycoplasmoides gallisepticum]
FLGHNSSKEEIIKVINELGIKEIQLNEKVKNLSGGEKQRIAIARAILRKSEFILADEPTGNLDTKNSENIFKIFSSLSKKRTIIVVSHDLEAAKKYGDYIYDLKNNELLENKPTCNEYLFKWYKK